MSRRLLVSLIAAVALATAACSDQQPQAPSGAEFTATQATPTCNFNQLNSLLSSYFPPDQQEIVRTLKHEMQAAGARTPGAVDKGFDIMAQMTIAAAGGADPVVGSQLARGLIKCMFDVSAEFTNFASVSFVRSLNADSGGFEVRGGSADPATDPVVAKSDGVILSGVAPPPGSTWADILDERVLIYGVPGAPTADLFRTYDWSMVRPNAGFVGGLAVVTTCLDDAGPLPAGVDGTKLMTTESNVGVLAFQDGTYICSFGSESSARGWASRALAQRLTRFMGSIFSPEPLSAAMVSPGIVSGRAGGLKSLFGPFEVESVDLAFVQQPGPSVINRAITPAVSVKAFLSSGMTPVAGVRVTLIAQTNNGSKVVPSFNTAVTEIETDANGSKVAIARFPHLLLNKPGGYILVASGEVLGRNSAVTSASSNRFHEKSK